MLRVGFFSKNVVLYVLTFLFLFPVTADYLDEIGYRSLQQRLGAAMPNGSGIDFMQGESPNSNDYYWPDRSSSDFDNDEIILEGDLKDADLTHYSGHATSVAKILYGSNGMCSGENSVYSHDVNSWFVDVYYQRTPSDLVFNHSWIGSLNPDGNYDTYYGIVDCEIENKNFNFFVGVNNGASTSLPNLLCQGYNMISVGRSDGKHSAGLTTHLVTGRSKPDIVAPMGVTSTAIPVVGATAALLLEVIRGDFSLSAADRPDVMKAILTAGASKDKLLHWGNTTFRPLDPVFGSGEVNIENSYDILMAGEFEAGSQAGLYGWDSGRTGGSPSIYSFVLSGTSNTFSASLCWLRKTWYPSQVPNLSLELYSTDANGSKVETIFLSDSPVDNIELIHCNSLPSGTYELSVSGPFQTDYALAWRTFPQSLVLQTNPL